MKRILHVFFYEHEALDAFRKEHPNEPHKLFRQEVQTESELHRYAKASTVEDAYRFAGTQWDQIRYRGSKPIPWHVRERFIRLEKRST